MSGLGICIYIYILLQFQTACRYYSHIMFSFVGRNVLVVHFNQLFVCAHTVDVISRFFLIVTDYITYSLTLFQTDLTNEPLFQ